MERLPLCLGKCCSDTLRRGEGALSLDGEVVSAMVGADFALDRTIVGLALALSSCDGSYQGAGSGEVESALTGLYPYGRYQVSERLSLSGAS